MNDFVLKRACIKPGSPVAFPPDCALERTLGQLPLHDYASLPAQQRSFIERTFGPFSMLSQVLEWGRELEPPVAVDEIITMDEYTHDVLVRLPGGRYLAFDTT